MKICIRCNENKPLNKFGNHPTAKDGKRNQCESCRYQLRKNRPKHDHQIKNYRAARYGITMEEFNLMLNNQNNACAICKSNFIKNPHIDHCHETKIVRGLLCGNCNTGIGLLRDDPKLLKEAFKYLSGLKGE